MDVQAEGIKPWELPDLPEDHVLAREWKTYKREVQRLLAEGHEGRHALIKGDVVVSVWDTSRDAVQAGHSHFGTGPFMVQMIVEVVEFPTKSG
jgi:hypothetical protein